MAVQDLVQILRRRTIRERNFSPPTRCTHAPGDTTLLRPRCRRSRRSRFHIDNEAYLRNESARTESATTHHTRRPCMETARVE